MNTKIFYELKLSMVEQLNSDAKKWMEWEEKTLPPALEILRHAMLLEHKTEEIIKMCELLSASNFFLSTDVKNLRPVERKLRTIINRLNKYVPYRFVFMEGAFARTFTIFATSHKEAWEKANDITINNYDGNILGVFCLTKDGEDVGSLNVMNGFFTEDTNKIRSIKATDWIPGWKPTDYSKTNNNQ